MVAPVYKWKRVVILYLQPKRCSLHRLRFSLFKEPSLLLSLCVPLQAGDDITQVEPVDDQWILGVVGGRRGIFPKNYISFLWWGDFWRKIDFLCLQLLSVTRAGNGGATYRQCFLISFFIFFLVSFYRPFVTELKKQEVLTWFGLETLSESRQRDGPSLPWRRNGTDLVSCPVWRFLCGTGFDL